MCNAAKSLYKEGLQSIICSFEHYNSLVKSFFGNKYITHQEACCQIIRN